MEKLIDDNSLTGTFAYLDNLTVCGCDQADHDANVSRFLDMIKSHGLTLNKGKTISSVETINILGFLISKGTIRPDPEKIQPLRDLPGPHDPASLKRALGLFSYYSQWISKFSDKIDPLTNDPTFPLSTTAVQAFNGLKRDIMNSWISCPNKHDLLVVETDDSDSALSASLNQGGKPIAFFSQSSKTT